MIKNACLIIREKGAKKFFMALYFRLLILFLKVIPVKRFVIRSIYNYKMFLDIKDAGISRSLLLHAERELDHKKMLEEVVKPGMTIFDIGANIGYYVLMEHDLLKGTGKVVAIEPSPTNIELLKKNLALNSVNDVLVYQMAISNKVEKKEFYLAKQSNLNTFHATGSGKAHLSGEIITVDTETVPSISETAKLTPDLIRMDVEGHEVEVIEGLLEAIDQGKMKPAIIFETHISRYTQDHDFSKILLALFEKGYKAKIIASSSERGEGIISQRGYKSYCSVDSDFVKRSLYRDIKDSDAVDFICRTGGVRTVYLEHVG